MRSTARHRTTPRHPTTAIDVEMFVRAERRDRFANRRAASATMARDARSGSVKRCASAVGEGAMAVSFIHASLEAASPAKDVSASTN